MTDQERGDVAPTALLLQGQSPEKEVDQERVEIDQYHRSGTVAALLEEQGGQELSVTDFLVNTFKHISRFLPLGLGVAAVALTCWNIVVQVLVHIPGESRLGSEPVLQGFAACCLSVISCAICCSSYYDLFYGADLSLQGIQMSVCTLRIFVQVSAIWVVFSFLPTIAATGHRISLAMLLVMAFIKSTSHYVSFEAVAMLTVHPVAGSGEPMKIVLRRIVEGCWGMFKHTAVGVLATLVCPLLQKELQARSALLAALFSIAIPLAAKAVLATNFNAPFGTPAKRFYSFACLAEAQAEFILKQAIYTSDSLAAIAVTLLGQACTEILVMQWAEPLLIRLKTAAASAWRGSGGMLQKEPAPAQTGLQREQEEQEEQEQMVRAACRADIRLGMEYVAHCGAVAAKLASCSDLRSVRRLLLAGALAVALEVLCDVASVWWWRRGSGLRGRGLHMSYWEAMGMRPIFFLCLHFTFLCMMQPFCGLSL